MCRENKNNDFIQQFVSPTSPYSVILESITYVNSVCNVCTRIRCLCSDQSVNNVNGVSVYIRCICCLCMWYSPKSCYRVTWGDELLNKVVIFVFSAHKRYSRSFVKLHLNHWCYVDYFNDFLATFLSLDRGKTLAVYGEICVTNLIIIIQIIIIIQNKIVLRRRTKVLQVWNDMMASN